MQAVLLIILMYIMYIIYIIYIMYIMYIMFIFAGVARHYLLQLLLGTRHYLM